MKTVDYNFLAEQLVKTARQAGLVQLALYKKDIRIDYKADKSPVSQADTESEKIILDDLARISPDIPVLAEEAASDGNIPVLGETFFCVDPLDGTKEFISQNDEFTINIALIDKETPVFGLVYAPALHDLYLTLGLSSSVHIRLDANAPEIAFKDMVRTPLQTRKKPRDEGVFVVTSRSHMSLATKDYLKKFKIAKLRSAGSSLKFCLVASGEADLYPRLAPTMEWDTAAGHAVVLAAGGSVVTEDGTALHYNKKEGQDGSFRNPSFIAKA